MVKLVTQVSTSGDMDTERRADSGERRQWSEALKRQIVAEAQEPGASMSIVARRHEANANPAFKWRREMVAKRERHRAAGGDSAGAWRRRLRLWWARTRSQVTFSAFRRRPGDLIKLLWWDGDGLCLLAKRLERGRSVWPRTAAGGQW